MTWQTQADFYAASKISDDMLCTTVRYNYYDNTVIYSGAHSDILDLILFPYSCHGEGCFGLIVYPIALVGGIVDLPLSFVADSLILPYTIPLAYKMNCDKTK
ncbi:YceK/YidQ family lipoprotein [Geotalea sp. SG265]|uniref:YceK/YidQ family lipoprotein n=1 Tax=Geotalea sp. SG265 TaxID=2922867 RepID=UPI001FAEFAFB|nr:YceK/YidQ family lipoprotein [Geotalea sp. SG265]